MVKRFAQSEGTKQMKKGTVVEGCVSFVEGRPRDAILAAELEASGGGVSLGLPLFAAATAAAFVGIDALGCVLCGGWFMRETESCLSEVLPQLAIWLVMMGAVGGWQRWSEHADVESLAEVSTPLSCGWCVRHVIEPVGGAQVPTVEAEEWLRAQPNRVDNPLAVAMGTAEGEPEPKPEPELELEPGPE